MYTEEDFFIKNYSSRKELREMVVGKFLQEEPGIGSGQNASKYRYNVETLKDGRIVYLTRPAYLKKGFDFRINVSNTIFQTKGEYPKHDDIFDDLKLKFDENVELCRRLHNAIERVFNCEDPEDILPEYVDVIFTQGHPLDLIIKVIKWFFIEQDIRDWNYSGRQMFKNGVDSILLQ